MVKRRKLIIEGNIQNVGYRVIVKQIARKLGIKGYVENLKDGTVKIVCESSEEKLEQFQNKINIQKGDKDNIFSLYVENIKIDKEEEIEEPESKPFEIGYDIDDITPFQKENLERLEIGSVLLSDFKTTTNKNFINMDKKYGKISKNIENLANELKEQREILIDELSTFRNSMDSMGDKIESGIIKGMEKAMENQNK